MNSKMLKFICSNILRTNQVLCESRRSLTVNSDFKYDLVVVGGGVVGVASAREILQRHPKLKVAVLEKEEQLAKHQSGNNSGVIHAGIYYKPGSLKAKLCVEGHRLMYQYLDAKKIPYKKCGKLIVATNELEVERLMVLWDRGLQNKCPNIELVDKARILELEPYCKGGVKAIWSPDTGIVDYSMVTRSYGDDVKKSGGSIHLKYEAAKFTESGDPNYPIQIEAKNDKPTISTKYVLTCGGLHSDQLAEKTGCTRDPRIIPVRGEYLLLNKDKIHMINGNIYPVPDPTLPFLGVHFTPRMDGNIWLGPNAVLAFKREGYTWSSFNLSELYDAVTYPGFIKMAMKHFVSGTAEMTRSFFLSMQVKQLQKYIPEINVNDVSRGPAGVRAQAMDIQGNLIEDFVFDQGSGESQIAKRVIHCRNAPSPGATSSLAIAKMIADKLEDQFSLK